MTRHLYLIKMISKSYSSLFLPIMKGLRWKKAKRRILLAIRKIQVKTLFSLAMRKKFRKGKTSKISPSIEQELSNSKTNNIEIKAPMYMPRRLIIRWISGRPTARPVRQPRAASSPSCQRKKCLWNLRKHK